jgi:regulation of enolase protein 1 (concanavalin A-like superfamily)
MNKGGAPTKLNFAIIKRFDEVVNQDINAIIFTDEELCLLVNEKLDDLDKFSYSTFCEWKAHIVGGRVNKKDTDDIVVPEENQKLYNKLGDIIKKALASQKKNLFKKMQDGEEKAWQRYAWIIERKFSDWNMVKRNEHAGPNGGPLNLNLGEPDPEYLEWKKQKNKK